jgi:hypothetical protein
MKPLLSALIHENQKGFLKNRYIGENSRLLYDIIHYCNDNNKPGLVLLVDFEKAFDSVSWNFMFKTLRFFKFGENFIKWVNLLFSKASLCVIQNGFFSDFFHIGRGCRQGDPISPYLFILCAEIMGTLIRKNLDIKGIVIKGKEYKLLQYADEAVFKFRKIVDIQMVDSIVQPVWYNNNIKICEKSIFYKHWMQKGVHYIYDFFNENGQLLEFEDFCEKFDIQVPFTTFYGIINSIRKMNLTHDVNRIMNNNPYYPVFLKHIFSSDKGSRKMYDAITSSAIAKQKYEIKWENELNLNVDRCWWKIHNQIIFKTSKDVQMQWFQYRIVHRILSTNVFLKKIGIIQSDLCSFCKLYPETITHLFWECIFVEELWDALFQWINDQLGLVIDVNIVDILFGKISKHHDVLNLLICLTKRHIYKKRRNNVLPSFEGLKKEILYYRDIEKHIFVNDMNETKFNNRWGNFSSLK